MKHVELWADGASKGNGTENAAAGFGVILKMGSYEKEFSGKVPGAQTNNRAELTAVIYGLSKLKYSCEVTVYTDSSVVCSAPDCILRGYRTSNKKPAANRDLLEKLAHLLNIHKVKFEKVTGHSGNKYNELCDRLASLACFNEEYTVDANEKRAYADWCLSNNWRNLDHEAGTFVMGEGWDDEEYEKWVMRTNKNYK